MEIENKYNFRIKFEKEEHSLNTDTYVQSLLSLSTIIREINYQIGTGPAVAVNVLTQEPGSFDVGLELFINEHSNVIAAAGTLSTIVGTTIALIQLKLAISKTDNAQVDVEGDKVRIKDAEGNVVFETNKFTYEIYDKNQAVNDAVSTQFQAVNKDEEVQAIKISDEGSYAVIQKEDFEKLAERRIIEVKDTEEDTVPASLKISKLVLDNPDRKWEFVWQGSKIAAKIADESFWAKIIAGEIRFANGDVLIADLNIFREYDHTLDVYLNKDYQVTNIRQHLPRANSSQSSFDDLEVDI